MILYGASGHAKVIIDILRKNNIVVTTLLDDDINILTLNEYKVTHSSKFENLKEDYIISIGNNKIRKQIVERNAFKYGTAIHPQSITDPSIKISLGTVVMAGVVINAHTVIGAHCVINTSASIDHDCVLADFVHISPNATLCGGVQIGEGTHIGAGATVIPNIQIGKWCTIGAGAVILRDIPDHSTVVGNPGRVI